MKGSAKLREQSKSPPVLFSSVTPAEAGRSIFEIHLAPISISVVPVVGIIYCINPGGRGNIIEHHIGYLKNLWLRYS